MFAYESGYVVIGNPGQDGSGGFVDSTSEMKCICKLYNSQLEQKKEIVLSDLLSNDVIVSLNSIDVSSDGNKIIFATFTVGKALRGELLMLLILLLVPALNLSSLISSRMDMRSSELGVRKSFGANRGVLLWQVMWENLLLTGIGALAGLAVVWAMMLFTSGEILTVSNGFFDNVAAPTSVNIDMFFSPGIFLIVLGLCLLLNLLSALVPAWMNLRKPIVSSLKEK